MSSLYDAIHSNISKVIAQMYTTLPAKVEKVYTVDSSTVVDVQPLINITSPEGVVRENILQEVPIQWPSGGGFKFTCPLAVGDNVLLHFSMKAINEWKNSDGSTPTTVSRGRRFNKNDAFAVPSIFTFKTGSELDTEALTLGSEEMEIRITKEGTIELGRGATEKLVLGDTFLALYNSLSVPTGVGPSGPPITPMDANLHLSQKVTTL